MFLSYYGLREQPFGVTPDPRFLYETPMHREALASLVYGIESGSGFSAMIAEPGMGKTTILFHLLERYRDTARSAFLFDTQCNSHELLQNLLADLELDPGGNDADRHARFKNFLVKQAQEGRRVLLLIDEAQNLDHKVLETVRLLSNFETPREKLIHIILSGQPQLETTLAKPAMLQLRQRITLMTRLSAFTPEQIAAYVAHRLRVSGYRGAPLFTTAALAILAAETRGIPRDINRMCFNALSLGCALQTRRIDAEQMREVAKDLRLNEGGQPSLRTEVQQEQVSSAASDPSPADECVLSDPFLPRSRPAEAGIPETAAQPVSTPVAVLPEEAERGSEEAQVVETDLAVQRALLDVALKSHQRGSHLSVAGVAVVVPLLLWLTAYLLFRFDLVSLLHR
jgi:general secretion pathway protein A